MGGVEYARKGNPLGRLELPNKFQGLHHCQESLEKEDGFRVRSLEKRTG
jgi:hypothetical protein